MSAEIVVVAVVAVHLVVVLILVARYLPRVFVVRWRMDAWDAFVVDLASTDLSGDPVSTRLRRQIAAGLLIVAHALLWPKNVLASILMRPLLRHDALGRPLPRGGRVVSVFYANFFVTAALFAAMPAALVVLVRSGASDAPAAHALAGVLMASLFARHLAMLVFPHDLKAALRCTLGDPRLLFATIFCIDVFAFAALVLHASPPSGAWSTIDVLGRIVFDLVSVSEARGLLDSIGESHAGGLMAMLRAVPGHLAAVTGKQALEIACSGLIYLNLVRMALPLGSWRTTDEDRKLLARALIVMGLPAAAQAYLDGIKAPDAETARIDAVLAANRGDFVAARHKALWANARDGLGADPDLMFLEIVIPSLGLPRTDPEPDAALTFALELGVSDAVLAMGLLGLVSSERLGPARAARLLAGRANWAGYPLSTAVLRLGTGDPAGARGAIAGCRPAGLVEEGAALLLDEVALSFERSAPAPSIHAMAERLTGVLTDDALAALSLAHGLALVYILVMLRMAVAVAGGDTAAIGAHGGRLLARLREHYPGHRDTLAALESYAPMAELQARRHAQLGA